MVLGAKSLVCDGDPAYSSSISTWNGNGTFPTKEDNADGVIIKDLMSETEV